MKKILLFVLLLSEIPLLHAQPAATQIIKKRNEKLELILRLQDLRTIHNGKLLSFLSDLDPVVRERTVRAFGSVQDTVVIPLLVEALSDRDTAVQHSAAFAIGQTAGQLRGKSRHRLEHDLIWARFDRTSVPDRLIEEIGKFGSAEALHELLLKFGTGYPLRHTTAIMMSIARFAIREVVSDDAVEYLLRFVKPSDAAPWQAVYALQRIGNHEQTRYEIEHLVQLHKHQDPLVRMHLAALLGKLKDEKTSLEPLQKLAEFDGDWRVRAYALKALGSFDLHGKDPIVRTFFRSFSDENMHVVLTALSTFGNTGLKGSNEIVQQTFDLLRRMAANKDGHYLWQIQGEAAIALAKLEGRNALSYIRVADWSQRYLRYDMVTALAKTGAKNTEPVLRQYLDSDDPLLVRGALDGLGTLTRANPDDSLLAQKTYDACLQSLQSDDVSIVTTAASLLGDSLFLRARSIDPLLETLSRLRLPHDIEAMQEIIATLGKLRDRRAVETLQKYLRRPDRSVALASVAALTAITGKDYSSSLPRSFEPLFTDFDFQFLRSLRDTVSVKMETIRGDVVMELYKNAAPFTVMSFLKLARRGFYRGLSFHRVVPNFVVQGGDPRGDGWGGPGYSLRSEFSALRFDEGAVGLASAGKDTEGSQFFITHSPQPHLDGRYTVLGKVVSGMEVVNRIQVDDRIFEVKLFP